ncbi:MAG: hypothetical protein F6K19_01675 [Cyanothece sp. SIO1E1]|nr:hypothetical protein [Cyanothece sp. SIO1E1]
MDEVYNKFFTPVTTEESPVDTVETEVVETPVPEDTEVPETVEGGQPDGEDTQVPEGGVETQPETEDALPNREAIESEIYSNLAKVLGIEGNSLDALKAGIDELSKPKEVQFRDELARRIYEIDQNGGDIRANLSLFAMDPDRADASLLMRNEYLEKNKVDLEGFSDEQVERYYNRHINKNYGKFLKWNSMSGEEKSEYYEENKSDIEDEKMDWELGEQRARRNLKKLQDDVFQKQVEHDSGMTPEQMEEWTSQRMQERDSALNGLPKLDIALSDTSLEYILTSEDKDFLTEATKDPTITLKSLGIDTENASMDYGRILELLTWAHVGPKQGKLMESKLIERANKKAVTTKLENPPVEDTKVAPANNDVKNFIAEVKKKHFF